MDMRLSLPDNCSAPHSSTERKAYDTSDKFGSGFNGPLGPDSVRTDQLVRDIRKAAPDIRDTTGASVAVTGTTAVNIDVSNRLSDSLLPGR
jgi:RND superfamily putative drug exporter